MNALTNILLALFGGAFLALLYRQFDNIDKRFNEQKADMIRLFAEQKADMIRLFAEQKADTIRLFAEQKADNDKHFDKLEEKLGVPK